jgi:hypothetical protein
LFLDLKFEVLYLSRLPIWESGVQRNEVISSFFLYSFEDNDKEKIFSNLPFHNLRVFSLQPIRTSHINKFVCGPPHVCYKLVVGSTYKL